MGGQWYPETVAAPPQFQGTGTNSTNRSWTAGEVGERHKELLSLPSEIRHLTDVRGLTLDSVCRFKIGTFSPGVYMIPVFDDLGALLAVRYYRASDHRKWGVKDVSTKMLYPLLGMNGANPLWFCEGEFDAMIGIQNGLHIITTTAGATATPATLEIEKNMNYFGPHRRFVLAFDNDLPGYVATARLGLATLRGKIEGVVSWPTEFKKDISDWYNTAHDTAGLEELVVPFNDEWALSIIDLACKHYTDRGQRIPDTLTDILDLHRKPSLLSVGVPVGAGDAWEEPAKAVTETITPPEDHHVAPHAGNSDFDLDALWPTKGFLREYIDFASETTDAPDQFHAATALTVFGMATKRQIYYVSDKKIYPNLFVALIAESSVYRKSTSISKGSKLLFRSNPGLCLPRSFSTESFLSYLSKVSSKGMLYFSEFAELLDLFKKGYAEGLLAILTDFYDCPNEFTGHTQKSGSQIITDPFVSILGASTVEWLNKNLTDDHMQGGFWPRFLFFTADKRKPLMEMPPQEDTTKRDLLVYRLKAVGDMSGRVTMTEDAKKMFTLWIRAADNLASKSSGGLGVYVSRLSTTVYKIAMLFCISEYGALVIDDFCMERALKLCDWLLRSYAHLCKYEIACDKAEASEQKLIKIARNFPGITERDAMRSMHLPANTFRVVLESCCSKEYIRVENTRFANGRSVRKLHLGIT